MALFWPSAYSGVVTQRWGPVVLANEPAGFADAQKADSSNFAGAVYGAHVHRGLDIRAYEGTDLYAGEAGTIVKATSFANGELYVQLRINATTVLQYDHCSGFVAHVGDVVRRGQLIARAGSTGNVTAAHLHLEVQITEGGRVFRYNPALFLAGGALATDPRILPPGASSSGDVNLNPVTQAAPLLGDVVPTTLFLDEACTVTDAPAVRLVDPATLGFYATAASPGVKALPARVDYGEAGSDWRLRYVPFVNIVFGSIHALPGLCEAAPPVPTEPVDTDASFNAGVDAAVEAAKKARKP